MGELKKRTVQNYLAELVGIGVFNYDPEEKRYAWFEDLRVLSGKEHEIALKHSMSLVFSTRDKQRLDQMNPSWAVEWIVFHDRIEDKTMDNLCIFQHLKSGYPEVYELMEKYRKIYSSKYLTRTAGFVQESTTEVPVRPLNPKKEPKRAKEAENVEDLLIGKIYSIARQVKHGTPLEGHCDYCPKRKIRIQD
jgi:hypothetical protein